MVFAASFENIQFGVLGILGGVWNVVEPQNMPVPILRHVSCLGVKFGHQKVPGPWRLGEYSCAAVLGSECGVSRRGSDLSVSPAKETSLAPVICIVVEWRIPVAMFSILGFKCLPSRSQLINSE